LLDLATTGTQRLPDNHHPKQRDLDLASAVDPRGQVLFHHWRHLRSLTSESLSDLLARFGFSLIVTHDIEINDRIFGAREGGLASRPEFANLFNTYRPMIIGNRESLFGIAACNEVAAAGPVSVLSTIGRRPLS
jgi:hypothetical protein